MPYPLVSPPLPPFPRLSSPHALPPVEDDVEIFKVLSFDTIAVMKLAVEPLNPSDLPKVLTGLRKVRVGGLGGRGEGKARPPSRIGRLCAW
jgi:hypothetical protein